jgi:hypothetical protein
MTEMFGASSVMLDQPISRTANPDWFPTLTGRITEATVPFFLTTAVASRVQFKLPDKWLARIAQVNAGNPKGSQVFQFGFGIFQNPSLMFSLTEEGNLLRFSRLDYAFGHRVGIVKTYNLNDDPPMDEDFKTRPDLWHKCTNINQYDQLLNPYQGDLYFPLITDGTEIFIDMDLVEPWPILPVTVTVRSDIAGLNGRSAPVYPANNIVKTYAPGSTLVIQKYAAVGCWIWGLTQDSVWVALRVVPAGSNTPAYFTSWKISTPPPFAPVS